MSKRNKKYTYEEVKEIFSKNNCVLLSSEYINVKSVLEFLCSCGQKNEVVFNNFLNRGSNCIVCKPRKKRYTIQEVQKIFKENGFTLLSLEYNNNQEKLNYICSCGNQSKISLACVLRGQRCKKCSSKDKGEKQRFSIEFVRNYFEQNGCILLSENYTKNNVKLDYICQCGEKAKISFQSFLQGSRCKKCGIIKRSESRKYKYEEVKNFFEDNGCVLLSEEYIDSDHPLDIICKCGNKATVFLLNYKRYGGCIKCGKEKLSEMFRHDYDFIKKYFEDEGCFLLSDNYTNARQQLRYICSCGNESKIVFDSFRRGTRCNDCGTKRSAKKRSGENSNLWNGGVSQIRSYLRNHLVYWKKESMKQCNYRCVITGEIFEEIHHLYSFDKIVHETFEKVNLPIKQIISDYTEEELDIIRETCLQLHDFYGLGVCLTEKIHTEFHDLYGAGNNNPLQFEEFKQMKLKQLKSASA